MTDQVERLLRDTFAGRAATITRGPQHVPAPSPRHRPRPWLAAAAAAVTVIGVAGGVAALQGTGSTPAAGGGSGAVCTANLPASWRTALDAPPITVDGRAALVDGVLGNGSAVAEVLHGRFAQRVLLVSPAGTVTSVYTEPTPRGGFTIDVGDRYIVRSFSGEHRDAKGILMASGTADIVAIDGRTHQLSHLLADAPRALRPASAHGVSADNAVSFAVVQGDTVYWTVRTAGRPTTTGVVVGYDLRTGRYRQVGTYHGGGGVTRDARGVWWPGGSVAAPHVPAGAPAMSGETSFRSFDDDSVDTDGKDFAWADILRRTVHWAGPRGRHTAFHIDQQNANGDSGFQPIVGVAGPIVVMFTSDQDATYHLLDTRTGALADTHIGPGGSAFAVGSTLLLTRPIGTTKGNDTGTVRIDTATLPQLRCAKR